MPIVSGDTAYNHTDGNTYILLLHGYLYYCSQIKHRIINTNQICVNGLEFYDNPSIYEEFYVQLDDDMNIPLQFKVTKYTFLLRVMTRRELETYHNFDMKSDHEWDPESIDLNKIRKISQSRQIKRYVFRL